VQDLKQSRPKLLIQGDYNIAHTEQDIHNPASNQKTSGFLPAERAWMSKWLSEGGMVDTFRHLHPKEQKYSWWSMRVPSARANNKGWRIDYQCVSQELLPQVQESGILNEAVHSDHCPCWLRLS
jgi:exodeoxyribonuclease-3